MPTTGFQTFGAPHVIAMALTLALPVVLSAIARRAPAAAVATFIACLLAGALLVNEVTYWGYRIAELGVTRYVQAHLPLQVCSIAILATAATLISRSQRTYEIAYFWGLVGSSNAVITPGGLDVDFPGYRFFQYFVGHSGIVVGVLFATWGLGMRPTLAGLARAFVCLNIFAAGVAVLNLTLGSNYMYLSEPPAGTASPFFFAPWPWYLAFLEVIGLAFFFVALSPFLVAEWWAHPAARPVVRAAGEERAAREQSRTGAPR